MFVKNIKFLTERTQRFLYGLISQERCTGSVRGGVKAHLFGRRSFGKKVTLMWPRHKQETSRKEKGETIESKGSEDTRITQKTLEPIFCGIFSGSTTASCLTSRLTGRVIGLVYVASNQPNLLLRDCSHLALTRPLKRQVCQMFE